MYVACATLVLALFTAISACATAIMASHTKALVKKNDDILHQNERHHMDDLKPILVLEPNEANESINQFSSTDILPKNSDVAFLENKVCYDIRGKIINLGNGPAFDIVLLLRFDLNSQKELVTKFSALKSNDQKSLGSTRFQASNAKTELFDVNNHFKPEEYFRGFTKNVELFIIYTDVYNKRLATKQLIKPGNQSTIFLGQGDFDAHRISHI